MKEWTRATALLAQSELRAAVLLLLIRFTWDQLCCSAPVDDVIPGDPGVEKPQ